MKLIIEYDANHGYALPDGKTEAYADKIIALFLDQDEDMVVSVASAVFVDFFRLRLAEGVVTTDQIEFTFEGKTLKHNKHGRIEHWPNGYCDIPIGPMEKLLTIGSKSVKRKKLDKKYKI